MFHRLLHVRDVGGRGGGEREPLRGRRRVQLVVLGDEGVELVDVEVLEGPLEGVRIFSDARILLKFQALTTQTGG